MFCRKNVKRALAVLLAGAIAAGCFGLALAAGGASSEGPGDVLPPAEGAYVPTNRDTRPAPERAEIGCADLMGFSLLYETDLVRYYWRDDRDVIAVQDKASGYTMKTGVDLPYKDEVTDAVKALKKSGASDEEIIAAAQSYADDLNTTYVGIANSLVSVEYYDGSRTAFMGSAAQEGVTSTLSPVPGTDNRFVLHVDYQKPDIDLNVYLTLEESAITYEIPREEMGGADLGRMLSVIFTPFLGASGGRLNVFDPETMDYVKEDAYRVPGYVLVPDGSGALIRFVDNTSVFDPYVGDVYGRDPATSTYYNYTLMDNVPINDPVMPVFGIAHGRDQMGFVAWADQGGEYMEIVVNPDGTKSTTYTWAYPRFEYNVEYYQLYDELGNGFFDHLKEPFDYDVSMTYSFLFGDGTGATPAADYAGMALEYRRHLIETGELTSAGLTGDIPLRLDFIMADSESGIIGTSQVVVTTADDVRDILTEVVRSGITNVNSGLLGWQKKGESLSKPYKASFSMAIGTRGDFESMMEDMAALGVDVSFSRDMTTINQEMTGYYNTAVKCVSNWYASVDKSWLLPDNLPTLVFGYATPTKTAEWVRKLADKVGDMSGSLTLSGISNVLSANYSRTGAVTTLPEAVALYRKTLEDISGGMKLNLTRPNQYLWKYTSRYLQMPVGNSKYIFETDAVPFLQMVLAGTMELYAPYANFSFYTQDCILRMIDYNVSPSFILSKDPSWNLSDTYSANLYSTEYELYKEKIADIYGQVNGILREVQGMDWVSREVIENGVVVNTYRKDGMERTVIINYTGSPVSVGGTTVPAESAVAAG